MRSHGPGLVGSRNGNLVVLEFLGSRLVSGHKTGFVRCQCDCGNIVELPVGNAKRARYCSKKCGHTKHGQTDSHTYWVWAAMVQRCTNPKNKDFRYYGSRGIKLHEPWLQFENFLADMGSCPPGLTLERINNAGHYEPSNCAWKTRAEQSRNTRRNCKVTWQGETLTLTDWARKTGIRLATLYWRFHKGYSLERLFVSHEPSSV